MTTIGIIGAMDIEIQKLKERLNATTVLIRRESVENNETSNASDANVFDYNYDLTIWNNSDIMNLEKFESNLDEVSKQVFKFTSLAFFNIALIKLTKNKISLTQ